MKIELCDNISEWNDYVNRSDKSTIYHQIEWKDVFEKSFNHKPYYLVVKREGTVKGVLPLLLVSSRLFGKQLVSLPLHCVTGACAEDDEAQRKLIEAAIEIAKREHVDYFELRSTSKTPGPFITRENKASFVLNLADGQEKLWKGFKKQIRNRVRKAESSGLSVSFGRENLEEFYKTYALHMKSLGLPMPGLSFYRTVLNTFPKNSHIAVVAYKGKTIGAKFFMSYKDIVYLIWGASLKQYSEYMPNYLLTWETIKYAINLGFQYCDFGRSTIDTGPYYFKESWGGQMKQLYWQYYLNSHNRLPELNTENPKYKFAINVWKRLPMHVVEFVGPRIAKDIP